MAELDWDGLIETYAGRAYTFALGLTGNEPDARELVQDAFTKAMERIETRDASQPFEGWFLTVLKHLYLDGNRRYERRHGQPLDLPIGPGGLTVADAVPDAREEPLIARLEREESVKLVRRAMRALTPDARAILLMVDLQGLKYEEAAQVLDCPLNTIRSRIVRARAALRDRLLELEVSP
jgi:RNA polymerase sigma-70 factor (ECF subfamily)